jgi:hypothetical protein
METPNSQDYAQKPQRNCTFMNSAPLPEEFIDPVFAKTIPKCSFSMIENERFGLVLRENWIYKFRTDV